MIQRMKMKKYKIQKIPLKILFPIMIKIFVSYMIIVYVYKDPKERNEVILQ